jgi:hypothetical protein
MAKFKSLSKSDLVVSIPNGKDVKFKDGFYTTTKKTEIDAIKKCRDVVLIEIPKKVTVKPDMTE